MSPRRPPQPSQSDVIKALLLAMPTSQLASIANAANEEIARRQAASEKAPKLGRPTGRPSNPDSRSEVAERLGHVLGAERKAMGLTQQGVASIAGYSYKHVGSVERGETDSTCTFFVKAAQALGVKASEVMRKAGY